MLKKRKKQKQREQEQQQEEQEQQEYNEIRQYQKIINKIWAQLETGTLYHYADAILECAINAILDLAKPKF